MLARDIIDKVRERLGDKNEQRWSNKRLLTIISHGQLNICTTTGLLRREIYIPLAPNQTRFTLPDDCYTIKRVEYKGELLPLHTRSDIDSGRPITTDLTAYKSNLDMNKLDISPAITELSYIVEFVKGQDVDLQIHIEPEFGVAARTNSPNLIVLPKYGVTTGASLYGSFTAQTDFEPSDGYGEIAGTINDKSSVEFPESAYGVLTGIDFIASQSRFGFVTDVKEHIISGKFGIVADVASKEDSILVYYIAVPRQVLFESTKLDIPYIWEEILLHYVVGTALQDDNDANNIQRGEYELAKYQKELDKISDVSSKDFSANASNKYETQYRRV